MLDQGKDLDWFQLQRRSSRSPSSRWSAFALFLIWELTEDHPIVDLTPVQRRNFWVGTLAMLLAYGVFFGNVVLLPLWLQQYMGYTATWPAWCWRPWACSRSC